MNIRKAALAALAFFMVCFSNSAATSPGELVTHLFPHKDGEARLNTGGNQNNWLEVGRNGSVGWITYKTGGVDLSYTIGSTLTLYIDKVYTGGTVKVFALTQPVTIGEMNVEGNNLFYNAASPVATATLAVADEEKILRLNLGTLLNQGPFYGLVIEGVGSLRVDFGSKEGPVQPLIELHYAFATAAQVQQAIDAGLAAQAAAAAAQLSANTAQSAATAADASANSAQGYSVLAGQHAATAAGSVQQAQGFANQAGLYSGTAAASAGQAATSAGAASTSASAAAGSALTSQTAAGEAAGHADAAAASAGQAAASAGASASSAQASAGSAAASEGSALAAAGSAGAALSSAGAAAGSATAAQTSAGLAAASAIASAGSANDAGLSATAAAASATSAGSSASLASGSAQQAGAFAQSCATSSASAQVAATSATAAAASAEQFASTGGALTGQIIYTVNPTPPDGFSSTGIRVNYEKAWGSGVSMPGGRYDLASAVVNGKLYATGGYNGSSHLALNQAYDPISRTWATKAPMPQITHLHTLTESGGKLYSIGGLVGGVGTIGSAVFAYDPVSDSWTSLASIPTPRYGHAAAAYNGKIYVFGGWNTFTSALLEAGTAIYDIATNTWSTGAPIPTVRAALSATTVNGKIHVLGGWVSGVMNTHEVYDPATNTWSTAASMPVGRSDHGDVTEGGRIYLMGGVTAGAATSNAQYDVATDSWLDILPLVTTGRYRFAIGLLSGKIYVSAGRSGSTILSSTEEYTVPKSVYLIQKN